MGDLQRMHNRVAARTRPGSGDLPERFKRRLEAKARRQAAEEEAALKAALAQQQINAQRQRDKLLQDFQVQNTNQRAGISANQAAQDFGYRSKLTDQQQQGTLQRDELQNRFEAARQKRLAQEQEERDRRLFQFGQIENDQQFQNQMTRDAVQFDYTKDRDKFQQDATLKRDALQFGYGAIRDDQQFQNQITRDDFQQRNQLQRDRILNEFGTERDQLQQQNVLERDRLRNEFDVDADERRQGYTEENMYQREAADIAARWQEQVAQARNAGYDFSERQQKELREREAAFRKNVLNGNLDDGLKKRAMVEYQKNISAIIPEQKVVTPQQTFEQSIVRDEETGMKFMSIRDPKGFSRFEPLPMPGSQGPDRQQQQFEREAQKMLFERENEFEELVDRLATEIDPATELPKYKSRAEAEKAAMDRFARKELHYQDVYGLPPLAPYQRKADEQRMKQEQAQQVGQEYGSRIQQMLQQKIQAQQQGQKAPSLLNQMRQEVTGMENPGQQQPQQPTRITVSSGDFDKTIGELSISGDRGGEAAAAALQAVKDINAKHGGPPPDGSQEQQILFEALDFLYEMGIEIGPTSQPQKKTRSPARRARQRSYR
jgi:hypothetical protein